MSYHPNPDTAALLASAVGRRLSGPEARQLAATLRALVGGTSPGPGADAAVRARLLDAAELLERQAAGRRGTTSPA